ncbi:MAG: sensor domain-containing diguanylate cyclase [Alphaproteobacteria bacterium]|nr:sensor domain-containing diguanylate cyclase [Alphaproteobacteria bacterium]
MLAPALPPYDDERLRLLADLAILDSPPEEQFDRIVRLAKKMFDVPIALVSLVDANRQWFKACIGLPVRETGRDVSFCGHAILGDEIFVVEDTYDDPRFADNPLVIGAPFIRFYAGQPLRVAGGLKIGTLCIIDTAPRDFPAEDRAALRDLAAVLERELAAMHLATVDELTGLTNRRGFAAQGQKAFSLARRLKLPMAAIAFDLDKFKAINDTYGHATGDAALRVFADALRRSVRDADVTARLGGDEFAALLIDCPADRIDAVIARIRTLIVARVTETGFPAAIEFSAGFAAIDADAAADFDAARAQAGGEMYRRKNARKAARGA